MRTLILSGVADDDNGSSANLAALLPHGYLVEIAGNHMTAVLQPALGRAILDFLAQD